ncbi:MAG: iron(III) transport system substrate-binding protein [Mariniblastus sp.]|jgi:iron(III) transport system substrate-binding protein
MIRHRHKLTRSDMKIQNCGIDSIVTLMRWVMLGVLSMAAVGPMSGCIQKTDNEVVVYAALDREFSQPILDDLGQELGYRILPKFDQESNKTVGLVTGIIQNQSRPQADVFWNNEILHTLRLQKLGLLEVYRSPQADVFPEQFVSSQRQWHGFAARARVLLVNTELIPKAADHPSSIYDLADPKWKGQCAMAKPLFGTTATHAAVLFSELGESAAKKLLTEIQQNARIEGGNKQVAQKVARGQFAFGITDTDDAMIEIEQGHPVAIVFPDQAEGQFGTLLIPNTLAIIKNGPNPERAKRLVDRLLQPDVEERLAAGASAQIPLSQSVSIQSRVQMGAALKTMKVDFGDAADQWETAARFLNELFH